MLRLYEGKISPMLAKVGNESDLSRRTFIFEPKLDGTRCILYKKGKKIRMLNRRGNWFHHRFPEIVSDAKKLKGNIILDGEVIVLGKNGLPNFNLLQSRDQTENAFRIKLLSEQFPAALYVFDVLAHGNTDLTKLRLIERKHVLNTLPDLPALRKIFYTPQGEKLWKNICKLKMEGVMAKRKGSAYEIGVRSKNWLKVKNISSADCIICGYTLGQREYFASLVLGQYYQGKLVHVGQVGTGFSEEQIASLGKMLSKIRTKNSPFEQPPKLARKVIWIKPTYIAEVKFLEYTKNLHLRAPSFKRLRFDKPLKDCVIELS